MWTFHKTKQTFIDYFTKNNHEYIPSSSLVPDNDSSLLFTNSGMVQFKNIFLGNDTNLSRVCNYQKCIRAGGKHNDLDDVGKDSYHHTFFEMLGSWSFNYTSQKPGVDSVSYYKEIAIKLAWDLLTNVYCLDKNRLYVTYFEGNVENAIEGDIETKNLWLQHIPPERILPFGMKENFWEMGYTGPCGPCTEIHYDRQGGRDASELVNRDDPSVIEIWNLVFMQYNRDTDGTITSLKNKHVDTGMGLERLVSILQNCTNYQIDLFKDIINIIQKETKAVLYEDKYGSEDKNYINTAYRVIADHVRTMIFAINDGVKPSPNERGYVLRRIIRRAVRYISKLTVNEQLGLLSRLESVRISKSEVGLLSIIADKTIDFLIQYYPELNEKRDYIIKVVLTEEVKFIGVMNKGLKYFEKLTIDNSVQTNDLFKLYTTYGFPIDIIKQLCEEKNIIFSIKEYEEIMQDHIKKSKMGKQFKRFMGGRQ